MAKCPPIKQRWLDRVIEVYNFHVSQCQDNPGWRIQDTAKLLQRGYGPVAEDILLGKWLKTHYNQVSKFRYQTDAVVYVRKKKREIELTELSL